MVVFDFHLAEFPDLACRVISALSSTVPIYQDCGECFVLSCRTDLNFQVTACILVCSSWLWQHCSNHGSAYGSSHELLYLPTATEQRWSTMIWRCSAELGNPVHGNYVSSKPGSSRVGLLHPVLLLWLKSGIVACTKRYFASVE